MPSQRRVSAKLHNELQSYSSLLRALRVQDIMDVTKQLKQSNPFTLTPQDMRGRAGVDDLDDGAYDEDETAFDFPTRLSISPHPSLSQHSEQPAVSSSAKAKGKEKDTSVDPSQKKRARDNWTRWPLLINDVLKPEWTLDDEVGFIVSQLLKTQLPRPDFPVPVAHTSDSQEMGDLQAFVPRNLEFDPEDPDNPFYVPYITSVVSEYLSWLLALLASHMPARAAGMQNRIEPMNWRAVIDVVVSCGVPEFSNTQIVSNVIERMEAIYGPSILAVEGGKATRYRAVDRMKGKEKQQADFTKTFTEEISKYWKLDSTMIRDDLKSQRRQARVHKIQRLDETEFRPRKSSKAASSGRNAATAKYAAKASSKRKKASARKARRKVNEKKSKETQELPMLVRPPPTPPQTHSEARSSTQLRVSTRRSTRPRRSELSYELRSFLPPID